MLCFRIVTLVFFGELREPEVHALKERLVNYCLFKVVFVGSILEPELNGFDLCMWGMWFAILGAIKVRESAP